MQAIAQVKNITDGKFYAQDKAGNLRALKDGDQLLLGEKIVGGRINDANSMMTISFIDNESTEVVLHGAQSLLLDNTLLHGVVATDEAIVTASAWNKSLNVVDIEKLKDTTDAGDETAAGEEIATSSDNGVFVYGNRDGDSTDIVSDLREASFVDNINNEIESTVAIDILADSPDVVEPEEPETPEEPEEPETPEEPEEPETPEEPEEPEEPVDPIAPVEPEPVIPTNPITPPPPPPSATIDPKDPTDPTVPVPVDPTDPSKPLDPKDPALDVKGAVAVEGNNLVFTVKATDSVKPQEYTFTIEGLTATKDVDFTTNNIEFTNSVTYDSNTGLITVPAGVTEFDVVVKTVDDTLIENTETMKVSVGSSSAYGYILDNDSAGITIVGSETFEKVDGTATGDKVIGSVEVKITNAKTFSEDVSIMLNNGQTVVIKAGDTTTGLIDIETDRVDDVYKQGTTEYTVSIDSVSSSKVNVIQKDAVITIKDDIDPIKVTVVPTITKISTITKENIDKDGGFTAKAYDGEGNIATISKNDVPSGFGVLSNGETSNGADGQLYSGSPKELGVRTINGQLVSEKIVLDFNNDIKTLDVAFAWRATKESARVDFYNGSSHVGYAIVSDGGNNKDATVVYYAADNSVIKTVNAPGGSDTVDTAYTFDPGNGEVFNRAEFTAVGEGSDYLIHSVNYTQVIDSNILPLGESVNIMFEIQTEFKPQGSATAKVEIDGKTYDVVLDENGYGKVSIKADGAKDVEAKVIEIIGGNFEAVDLNSAKTTIYSNAIKIDDNNGNNDITGGGGNDVLLGDTGGVDSQFVAGKNYNIALIVDTSGSMSNASGTAGKTRMQLTIDALKNFVNSVKDHDGIVNVSLVEFNSLAKTPIEIKNLTSSNAQTLINAINSLKADGGTNYEDAFIKTITWFNANPNAGQAGEFENMTYFLTDGDPTFYGSSNVNQGYPNGAGGKTDYQSFKHAYEKFQDLSGKSVVHAIGIGKDVNKEYLKFFDNSTKSGELDIGSVTISDEYKYNTYTIIKGGTLSNGKIGEIDIVNTAEDLTAALQGSYNKDKLTSVGDDIIDGGAGNDIIFGDVINTDHLEWISRDVKNHADYMAKGSGVAALEKYLSINIAGYNSMSDEQKDIVKYNYIKEHHGDFDVDGDTRGGDDTIYGGSGNDIIYGQGGNDYIDGGTGADKLYGGAGDDILVSDFHTDANGVAIDVDTVVDGGVGFDTLILDGNNGIDFSKLNGVNNPISNIEAIDLTKGHHKLENIKISDILDMTEAGKNELIIFGDKEDTVSFADKDKWTMTKSIENINGTNYSFDVYTSTENDAVKLKIEQDITII